MTSSSIENPISRLLAVMFLCCPVASSAQAVSWADTPMGRVEALAVLQTLNADLLSHDSATLTLDGWCARHHLAVGAKVVADRVRGAEKPAPADVRLQLRLEPNEPVAYRRVQLRCGARILSEADNWYVPARLTPKINQELETTDVAFGRAVQGLHFQRHTISARLLWSPLPDGWDEGGGLPASPAVSQRIVVPDHVLEHRAVLTLPNGSPISEVVETYTREVLDFPQPSTVH